MFAAAMAMLEPRAGTAEEDAAALIVLAAALERCAPASLSGKVDRAAGVIGACLQAHGAHPPAAKGALECLTLILVASVPRSKWHPGVGPGFALILRFCADARPKVRKRAQRGVGEVLEAFAGAGAGSAGAVNLGRASDTIAEACKNVMTAPAQLATQASEAKGKKARAEVQEKLQRALTETLHLLGALKQWLALLANSQVVPIAQLTLDLMKLEQPLLARHASDVLFNLFIRRSEGLEPRSVGLLLSQVISVVEGWDQRDADTVTSLLHVVEGGVTRLCSADVDVALQCLPRAVHSIAPLVACESEGIRFSAAETLKRLIHAALTEETVREACSGEGGKSSAVSSVVAGIQGMLGLRFQAGWHMALPVVQVLLQMLSGEGGPAFAQGLLQKLGELAGGAEFDRLDMVEDAIGVAVRVWGPEKVLSTLPLDLEESLAGQAEGRAWLLPLLHKHVESSKLAFWGVHLVPLARKMGNASAALTKSGRTQEAAICGQLEGQIWLTFPAFCNWPVDTPESFKGVAKMLGDAMQHRPDLLPFICHGLCRLILQNAHVLQKNSEANNSDVDTDDGRSLSGDEDDGVPEDDGFTIGTAPDAYTPELAQASFEAVGKFAGNFLPLLFNLFSEGPTDARGVLQRTISAFSLVCDKVGLEKFFKGILKKLAVVLNQQSDAMDEKDVKALVEKRCIFMDLSLALVAGLHGEPLNTLFRISAGSVMDRDATVQKKAYKLLAELLGRHPDFADENLGQIMAILKDSHIDIAH